MSQFQPNFAEMILGWSLSTFVRQRRPVSKMAAITKNIYFFKWPKLLYFNPESAKFELYKHNDELFSIYYGIFMNFELLHILTDYAN